MREANNIAWNKLGELKMARINLKGGG